jgi:ankyrin repeat protein
MATLSVYVRAFEAGADANMRNRFGWTPLMLAASQANTAIIRVLLDAGADADARNDFGASPLAYAALKGSHAATEALLRAGASLYPDVYSYAKSGGHSNQRVFELLAEAQRSDLAP